MASPDILLALGATEIGAALGAAYLTLGTITLRPDNQAPGACAHTLWYVVPRHPPIINPQMRWNTLRRPMVSIEGHPLPSPHF